MTSTPTFSSDRPEVERWERKRGLNLFLKVSQKKIWLSYLSHNFLKINVQLSATQWMLDQKVNDGRLFMTPSGVRLKMYLLIHSEHADTVKMQRLLSTWSSCKDASSELLVEYSNHLKISPTPSQHRIGGVCVAISLTFLNWQCGIMFTSHTDRSGNVRKAPKFEQSASKSILLRKTGWNCALISLYLNDTVSSLSMMASYSIWVWLFRAATNRFYFIL